jgi:long-chain acyl-CoA synthetase
MKNRTIFEAFADSAKNFDCKPAMIFKETSLSYKDLLEKVVEIEYLFASAGVKSGSRVGVLLPNGFGFPLLALVASKMKFTLAPISNTLKPSQISRALKSYQLMHLVIPSSFKSTLHSLDLMGLREMVSIIEFLDTLKFSSYNIHFVNNYSEVSSQLVDNDNYIFLINSTSGSTGNPKPLIIDEATKLRRIFYATIDEFDLSSKDVILVSTPQYHSLGFRQSLVPLCVGGTAVIMKDFNVNEWVDHISRYGITFSISVSSQIYSVAKYLKHEDLPHLQSLRCIVSSSSIFSPEQRKICVQKFPCEIFEIYGTSEVGIVTKKKISFLDYEVRSVGRPIDLVDVKIFSVEDQRTEVLSGEVGLIGINTAFGFSGYFGVSVMTDEIFAGDYFLTGDLGYIDSTGELIFCGRIDDRIKISGITVYPIDVEYVVKLMKGVTDACVVGIPDSITGESLGLIAVCDKKVTEEDIYRYLIENIAAWQIPTCIKLVESVPKSPLGKVDKVEVKRLLGR